MKKRLENHQPQLQTTFSLSSSSSSNVASSKKHKLDPEIDGTSEADRNAVLLASRISRIQTMLSVTVNEKEKGHYANNALLRKILCEQAGIIPVYVDLDGENEVI
jgi:hypothetical protein